MNSLIYTKLEIKTDTELRMVSF